jgi:hypothetical protein
MGHCHLPPFVTFDESAFVTSLKQKANLCKIPVVPFAHSVKVLLVGGGDYDGHSASSWDWKLRKIQTYVKDFVLVERYAL